MTPKPSAKPQRLLVGIVLLGGLGLYVYATSVFQPLVQAVNDLGAGVRQASVQLQQVQQVVAQEGVVRQEYARLTSDLTKLRTALPMETTLPSAIQLLSDLAGESGVRIASIFPQRALDHPPASSRPDAAAPAPLQLYKEIPIEIEAVAGFHHLGMFLSRVESALQPMRVHKLHIDANHKEVKRQSIHVVIVAYFALADHAASGASKGGGG